ncbi:MAG: ABC transporter permease [Pseudomonadota bacterium]
MSAANRTIIGALASHWRRNPLQLLTFLAGLALATGLWSGVQAINSEARASYDAAAATLGEGQFDQIVARDGGRIAQSDFIAMRRAGWLVSPLVEGRRDGVRFIGVEPLSTPGGLPDLQLDPDAPLQGFLTRETLFANAETAALLGPDTVPENVAISVAPAVAPGLILGDIGIVQSLLGRKDLDRLLVAPEQPMRRAELSEIAPHLVVQDSLQRSDLGQMTDSFHLNLTAFGLLSFAVGIFIVHGAIGLAFEQRRGTLRTLRSLGVSLRRLTALIAVELFGLALIGASLGIVLGYLVAAALLPDVAATLRGLYGANITGTLSLRADWWLSGLAIALLGTALAMADKLWQVAHMPILASARPRAWSQATARGRRRQLGLSAVFFTTGLGLSLFGEGLLAGFALQGALLVGAALALPALLHVGLSAIERRTKIVTWQWFWADTRQQVPGLSLALMALLLAVSANIGVSTMVSSFRLTFVEFLDQRLASELYVNVANPEQSDQIERVLSRHADDVMPLLSMSSRAAGMPIDLDGIRVTDTYRENWRFLAMGPQAWDEVAAGRALIANEQFARRADLWVDDLVRIEGADPLPIAAIMADYGNPRGQLVISETLFRTMNPDATPRSFGARTSDADTLMRAVRQDTGLPEAAFINQAQIKAFSLDVFERTFTVTAALNILTLSVAGFALLMSLLTLADLRVPQLAPVWSAGLPRKTLARMELLRAMALAVCVFLLALPLGLALAWTLLAIVNVEAFGWRLPMFLFPVDYARLGLLAVIAACLAALWPAISLARLSPHRLLKVFADER